MYFKDKKYYMKKIKEDALIIVTGTLMSAAFVFLAFILL